MIISSLSLFCNIISTLPLVIPHDLFTCLLVLVDPILSSDAHFIFWNLIIYL